MIQACGMVLDSMKHIFWVGIPPSLDYQGKLRSRPEAASNHL